MKRYHGNMRQESEQALMIARTKLAILDPAIIFPT